MNRKPSEGWVLEGWELEGWELERKGWGLEELELEGWELEGWGLEGLELGRTCPLALCRKIFQFEFFYRNFQSGSCILDCCYFPKKILKKKCILLWAKTCVLIYTSKKGSKMIMIISPILWLIQDVWARKTTL